MDFETAFKLLESRKYFVFSDAEIAAFFPEVKKENISVYLSRWEKSGKLARLRKGVYELIYPDKRVIPDLYIANKLYFPSYVSMETALSRYGLIPEIAMECVSLTAKTSRKFTNEYGSFVYHSVQPEAFNGYRTEDHGGFEILIAVPEKALVDYLYFKRRKGLKDEASLERMDMKAVKKLDKKAMERYAVAYKMNLKELFYAKS